jgi:hypothetical protein
MATRFINKLSVPFGTGNITDLRLYMKSPVIDYKENFYVILWWPGKPIYIRNYQEWQQSFFHYNQVALALPQKELFH